MSTRFLPFAAPTSLLIALGLAAAAVAVLFVRRLRISRRPKLVLASGILLLALAAGEPNWMLPAAREVAVLVDLSPSTRGAGYRNREHLIRRIRELLGDTPFHIEVFTDGSPTSDRGGELTEIAAGRTQYAPPAAAAVLLFSDGQFPVPAAAPRTFAVIDPQLAVVGDARVAALRIEGSDAVAQVDSNVARDSLTWSGVAEAGKGDTVAVGSYLLRRPLAAGSSTVAARLAGGDAWPENDALSVSPPPPVALERWFVSDGGTPPAGYRLTSPANLPADPAAYLAASVIVLDNLPAGSIPPISREHLTQYVRDLGGGLLISGGDRAFAAGGYIGTSLDALSPLASVPPRPATHWILLTDASGSMNAAASESRGSRWQEATDALLRLLPSLPPDDPVDIGSFAERTTWWSAGRSAQQTRGLQLPPANVSPRGPTDLRPALEEAAAHNDPALPAHLLLLSDADAELGDLPSLVALLKQRSVHLHVLAIEAGPALNDLTQVVRETGGKLIRQEQASQWSAAASELLAAATEKHLRREAISIRFGGPLASLPSARVDLWNRTWLKPRATELAATEPGGANSETFPLAAVWQVGEGRVAAAAFPASPAEMQAIAEKIARPPRDPRISVTWHSGPTLRVQIDAADPSPQAAQPYFNDKTFRLELAAAGTAPRQYPLRQTAPGRYELEIESPRSGVLATVRDGERVIDRLAVAARYAPEFDAIGINRENLQRLALQTGGRMVEANEAKPIDFRWPKRELPLTAWVATVGMLVLLAGMLWARIGRTQSV